MAGNAKHDFANRVVAGSRNALLDHPDEEVRNLKTFEKVKRVRLLSGQVNPREEADLDQIGVQAWNPVIYAAGETPRRASSSSSSFWSKRWPRRSCKPCQRLQCRCCRA